MWKRRGGYTLTELLVVIMIVVILVAAVLPIAKQVIDDSRTREASRLLGANFALASSLAAKNNRPSGLWFELEPPIGDTTLRQCTNVFLAEVQAPYAGSTTAVRGIIRMESGQNRFVPLVPVVYVDNTGPTGQPDGQWDDDANGDGIPDPADQLPADGRVDEDAAEKQFLLSLIDDGDLCQVRFDYKGSWFVCQRSGNDLNLTSPLGPGSTYPPSYNAAHAAGHSFQVLRSPRRVGNPMELTAGTCIDMSYSGMGPRGAGAQGDGGFVAMPPSAGARLVVMFNPAGDVNSLWLDSLPPVAAEGTLHFLIGKTESVNPAVGANADHPTNTFMFDPARSNLSDVNSVWVSLGRRNGSATSTENLPPPVDATTLSPTNVTIFPGEPAAPAGRRRNLNPTVQADREIYLGYCREVATGREQMGGK